MQIKRIFKNIRGYTSKLAENLNKNWYQKQKAGQNPGKYLRMGSDDFSSSVYIKLESA